MHASLEYHSSAKKEKTELPEMKRSVSNDSKKWVDPPERKISQPRIPAQNVKIPIEKQKIKVVSGPVLASR